MPKFNFKSPAVQKGGLLAIVGLNFALSIFLVIQNTRVRVGYVDTSKIVIPFVKEIDRKHQEAAKNQLEENTRLNKNLLERYEKIVKKVYNACIQRVTNGKNKDINNAVKVYISGNYTSENEKMRALQKAIDSVVRKMFTKREYAKMQQIHSEAERILTKKGSDTREELEKTHQDILKSIERLRKKKNLDFVVYTPLILCLGDMPQTYLQGASINKKNVCDLTDEAKKELGLPEEEDDKDKEEKK